MSDYGHANKIIAMLNKLPPDAAERNVKPDGWPDECHKCGAYWTNITYDYADGFCCRKCGACDSDE